MSATNVSPVKQPLSPANVAPASSPLRPVPAAQPLIQTSCNSVPRVEAKPVVQSDASQIPEKVSESNGVVTPEQRLNSRAADTAPKTALGVEQKPKCEPAPSGIKEKLSAAPIPEKKEAPPKGNEEQESAASLKIIKEEPQKVAPPKEKVVTFKPDVKQDENKPLNLEQEKKTVTPTAVLPAPGPALTITVLPATPPATTSATSTSSTPAATVESKEVTSSADELSAAESKKRKRDPKPSTSKQALEEEERKSKRVRLPTQMYQSPLPEFQMIEKMNTQPKTSKSDDKLTIFYKNEFLAVRNPEGGFYICQTFQNIRRGSHRIRIRWFTDLPDDVYTPDFCDRTEFDCILTNAQLVRLEKDKYKLPKEERTRIDNILKRALDVEKGVVAKPSVTEEHPDGLDLSLYNSETQLKKGKRARSTPRKRAKTSASKVENKRSTQASRLNDSTPTTSTAVAASANAKTKSKKKNKKNEKKPKIEKRAPALAASSSAPLQPTTSTSTTKLIFSMKDKKNNMSQKRTENAVKKQPGPSGTNVPAISRQNKKAMPKTPLTGSTSRTKSKAAATSIGQKSNATHAAPERTTRRAAASRKK